MCKKCDSKHQFGYYCSCECHQPIDTRIVERDKIKYRKDEESVR